MSEMGGADRKALVAAMRAFKFNNLDLSLLPGDDDMIGKKRDPKFYAPLKVRASARASGGIAAIGWAVLMFGRFPRRSEPIPFFVDNFWYMFGALFMLSAWAVYRGRVASTFTDNRWSELLRVNNLKDISPGVRFPTDTVIRQGVVQGIRLPGDASTVTFGTYDGWFDPDYPQQSTDYAQTDTSLYYQLFVDVYVPELDFDAIYVTPHRGPDFHALPPMSESAKSAIRDLSSRYAVIVGKGGITVTRAGDTVNSYASSMLASIEHASRWSLCIGIINKQLADIVEGLEV